MPTAGIEIKVGTKVPIILPMPAKNNTNLGLAAYFQANTLFRNRHIRVYYAVCAPRLSLKTRRNTCKQPKRRYFR